MERFYSYAMTLAIGIVIGLVLEKDGVVNNYFKNRRGIQNINNDTAPAEKKRRFRIFKKNRKK
jgi:hypothetical protein